MIRIIGCLFDGSGLVVKLLRVNAPVIIVQEVKDGWDEWRGFSGYGSAKGGESFGIYSFDYLLGDGSFEQ